MRKVKMLPAICSAHGERWRKDCGTCAAARRVNARYAERNWQPSMRYSLGLALLVLAILALFEWRF